METPQKRPKSWFSSLTGLVSGGRSSAHDDASANATANATNATSTASRATARTGSSLANGDRVSSRARGPAPGEQTPPTRYPGTFSAPPVESPESPAKRASPTILAQRKIHERVHGPSGRLASSSSNNLASSSNQAYSAGSLYLSAGRSSAATPRRTNFSSATTPRNMFRDSIARDMPAFTFTPRVPANTMRGHFPAATPGRSYRAPGVELGAREMAKVSSSDLFEMKIPEPDLALSGESIANMVPKDKVAKSVYASEYLAHLCPPDFTEEQRNQFFCILDLRRLKYAADEVFLKKDWRLNILNFAKEYEKNRSLIMLRYNLYTFKTVKVSRDVFQKWKTNNNIPDLDGEEAEAAPTSNSSDAAKALKSRPNGTEGILRAGKRKAQDNIDPASVGSASSSSAAQQGSKRSRPSEGASKPDVAAEREPLAETSTPALNKSKRKATRSEGPEQLQRAKLQKSTSANASAAAPSAAPSATKAFFEKVANSPAKDASAPASASAPSIHVSRPSSDSSSATPKSSPFKPSTAGQPSKPSANGSLARSVLESGLKASSAQNNNIFGYLSDASSAKGSGNDNADADAEDTDDSDGQEESETREASDSQNGAGSGDASTPQPSSSLFSVKPPIAQIAGSSSSSEHADTAPGRSLFDRVNKGSDGQPIRVFGKDGGASSPSPFQPATASLFGSKPPSARVSPDKEPAPASSTLQTTWTPDSPIKFAAAKPLFGGAPAPAPSASTEASAPSLFKFGPATTGPGAAAPTASAEKKAESEKAPEASKAADGTSTAPTSAPAPVFGFPSKPAESATPATSLFGSAGALGSTSTATPSLFGTAPAPPSSSAGASLFGNAPTTTAAATPAPAPAFGSSAGTPALQSQTLFGNAFKSSTPSAGGKRGADDDSAAKSTAPATGASLFGIANKSSASNGGDEPPAKKSLFGASMGGGAGASGTSESSTPLFSFGTPKPNGDAAKDKPAADATAKALETPSLFGKAPATSAAEPAKAQPVSLFGSTTPAAPAPGSGSLFSFGGASTNGATSQPSPAPFSFGVSSQPQQSTAPAQSSTLSFGGGNDTGSAGSSFTFNVGGAGGSQPFRNPFANGDSSGTTQATPSFSFGGGSSNGQAGAGAAPTLFQFGGGGTTGAAPATSTPGAGGLFSFGGASQTSTQATEGSAGTPTPGNSFGGNGSFTNDGVGSSVFSFGAGAASQSTGAPALFGQSKPPTGAPLFNLAPPVGGASSGTNTPFTNLGGASSLATTPATGTPEPGATQDNTDNSGHQADGDEAPQEQIKLTEGGPGEEDESVVHEVRAKAMRLVTGKDESESESPASKDKSKSPWRTEGVGPLRVLRNKATGAVRLLLRAEPRGHVALNKALLPDFSYKPEPNAKYVKLTTANETGTGLETWMLQVKTKEAAQKLAEVLEENKSANKKN